MNDKQPIKGVIYSMIRARDIAQMIDHSMVRPELTTDQIREGCRIAKKYGTITVSVRPSDVKIAVEELQGSGVKVGSIVGFPHGSSTTETKVFEARQAISEGAVELDMVLNIGRLLSGDFDYVERDIRAVIEIACEKKALVKVILENCFLSEALKEMACQICERAGADFVKTSTAFGPGGATMDDLLLMRKACSSKVQVKAAGGVRTLGAALAVRRIGVARFGATATARIMEDAIQREKEGTLEATKDSPLGSEY